jgi:hypothetical protein
LLPAQIAHEAQGEALDFARGALGAEASDDPLEAMLQSVRLASGVVTYWRHKLARINAPTRADEEGYERALLTQAGRRVGRMLRHRTGCV